MPCCYYAPKKGMKDRMLCLYCPLHTCVLSSLLIYILSLPYIYYLRPPPCVAELLPLELLPLLRVPPKLPLLCEECEPLKLLPRDVPLPLKWLLREELL